MPTTDLSLLEEVRVALEKEAALDRHLALTARTEAVAAQGTPRASERTHAAERCGRQQEIAVNRLDVLETAMSELRVLRGLADGSAGYEGQAPRADTVRLSDLAQLVRHFMAVSLGDRHYDALLTSVQELHALRAQLGDPRPEFVHSEIAGPAAAPGPRGR